MTTGVTTGVRHTFRVISGFNICVRDGRYEAHWARAVMAIGHGVDADFGQYLEVQVRYGNNWLLLQKCALFISRLSIVGGVVWCGYLQSSDGSVV